MKRRKFLQLSTTAAAGTPFLLNGMITRATNGFMDMPTSCTGVNDRVLVIVRLAGANDGLNTVIPISQYSTYATLRPNIRIQQTGANAYINLDSTLPQNQLSGLHPSLTGFKSLYDSGKLSILNGVGYPSPNLSHFKSENTMFAGKDGNTNAVLRSGMFGRYLSALYPGLAGNPNTQSPDPLAIQLGNTNPNLFYGHNHDIGIEYNMSNFQQELFNNLAPSFNLPQNSEYQDLLDYITQVEGAMDIYYNRVNDVFNAGSNSSVSYPNSDLGKQLKTVARMIQGGSKTKIFQVNLGGFDTHANQVQSGSSHLGTHNNLISDISNSITAFQNDIENLGIANKIMTVTFSEFGRQVRQNANFGTDHGTLSPFFVVGSNINPGVYGNHPVFTNTTSFQYEEDQRRYDYRQLFATLMQDWLGADDVLMQEAELNTFTANKIPIITAAANAYPACTMGIPECEDTITCVKIMDDNGWSYYAEAGTTDYLFAIEHLPTGAGANTNAFTAEITISKNCNAFPYNYFAKRVFSEGEAIYSIGHYWNLQMTSGSTNGFVNLRWFTTNQETQDVQTIAQDFRTTYGGNYISPVLDFKVQQVLELPEQFRDDAVGLTTDFQILPNPSTGTYNTAEYTQYDSVTLNTQTGGSKLVKVTNNTQNELRDLEDYAGMIRYNATTGKIEGFNGTQWVPFH